MEISIIKFSNKLKKFMNQNFWMVPYVLEQSFPHLSTCIALIQALTWIPLDMPDEHCNFSSIVSKYSYKNKGGTIC